MEEITKNALKQIENDYQEFRQAVFFLDLTALKILKKIIAKEKNFNEIGIKIKKTKTIKEIFSQEELETVCYNLWIKGAKNYYPHKKEPHCNYPCDFEDANLHHFSFLEKLNFKPSPELLGKIFAALMARNEYEAYKFSMNLLMAKQAIPVSLEVAKRLIESRNYTYFKQELIYDQINGPKEKKLSWQDYEKINKEKAIETLSKAKQLFLSWQHEYYSVLHLRDQLEPLKPPK
jgi:hypothetical protein